MPSLGPIYICKIKNPVQHCKTYPKKTVFKYLTAVFFALVCKANRVNPVDCSDVGMYSGIALKRDNIFYSKTEILYSVHPPLCDGGVQCKQFCSIDSTEWNFFFK